MVLQHPRAKVLVVEDEMMLRMRAVDIPVLANEGERALDWG
jgi:hypothetical protein